VWGSPFVLGTDGFDGVNAVAMLEGGRLALGGFVRGASPAPEGDSQGVLVVLSSGGVEVERQTFDQPGADSVDAVVAAGGRLIVAGRTEGTLAGPGNAGQSDLFVGLIEAHGVSLWQWGNERPQHPRRLAARDGGASVVVGGLDDVFVPSNYVEDWENPLALELQLGQLSEETPPRWSHMPRTPVSDFVGAVATSGADATFLAGTVTAGPERGTFVARLDAQGGEGWRVHPTAIGLDAIEAMAWAPDGSLVVAGVTLGPLGGAPIGGSDAFVAWLDPDDGSLLRARHLGTPAGEWVAGLVVADDGTAFIAGETGGSFGNHPAPADGADVFVAALPPGDGEPRVWQGGTSGDDIVTGVARDACGRLYVSGATAGAFSGTAPAGALDGFVLQVLDEQLAPP
jgi:hypothetical protein